MRFELLHAPMADGYGESVLPLADARAHVRAEGEDEDALVEALRDAAVEFVERWCSVKLQPSEGQVWRGEGFPGAVSRGLELGVGPPIAITSVAWLDADGAPVTGTVGDFRIGLHRRLFPAIAGQWPSGVGGGVEIEFSAGFESVPPALLSAVKLMFAHLWLHREAVVTGTISGEMPLGVEALCAPFRAVLI